MFLGVEYFTDEVPINIDISMRDQALPVLTRSHGRRMVPMGQGEPFIDQSPGHFLGWPEGNLVTLNTLHQPTGLWVKWRRSVRPVKIAVSRFFYSDALGYSTQHDLKTGEYLQGALLVKKVFERVYFVVVPQPGSAPAENRWWPRIIGRP
jgi:hypothetical protein